MSHRFPEGPFDNPQHTFLVGRALYEVGTLENATPHSIDTLDTAEQYSFASPAHSERDFDALMSEWYRLAVALNSLNRSVGLQDAYPFAIAPREGKAALRSRPPNSKAPGAE